MQTLRSLLLSAVAALSVTAVTVQPAAAAASSYTVNGNVYRVVDYVSSDANEIRVSTVVKGAAANETYAARVVPIKQSRFSSWFKPNLGTLIKSNLWWMGFAAIIESSGWAIDELKNEVVMPSSFLNTSAYGDIVGTTSSGRFSLNAYNDYISDNLGFKWGDPGWRLCTSSFSPIAICSGREGRALVRQFISQSGRWNWAYIFYEVPVAETYDSAPVSDVDLQAAINAQLAADPAHAATAFTDPATGRGYDELFDPVPYIPGLSAADEALVNCFISGQLQMVNSQAACYVATQAEYDRVKQQAEALAAGRTPDAAADALNSEMKQPLTQTQYEETNKKYSDAVADVTAALGSKAESDVSEIEDHFNELDGIITDLPNTSLPAPAHMTVPQYVDCQQIHLSDGNGHDLDFPSPSQCAKIETFKQGFGYFLAISVVFLLSMQLLTRPHG